MEIELLKTGIEKLDEILTGGIPKKHLLLIKGSPGTMKSTICFQTLFTATTQGMNTAYISLEQSTQSILTQMKLMKFDFTKVHLDSNDTKTIELFTKKKKNKKAGVITLLDMGLVRKKYGKKEEKNFKWLNAIKKEIKRINKRKLDLIAIDSINSINYLDSTKKLRTEFYYFFEFLKELELTSLIIFEEDNKEEYINGAYLADGIIELSQVKRNLKVSRELQVVKMRYIDHSSDIYTLKFDNKKGKLKLQQKMVVD